MRHLAFVVCLCILQLSESAPRDKFAALEEYLEGTTRELVYYKNKFLETVVNDVYERSAMEVSAAVVTKVQKVRDHLFDKAGKMPSNGKTTETQTKCYVLADSTLDTLNKHMTEYAKECYETSTKHMSLGIVGIIDNLIVERITKIKQDMKAKDLNKSDEAVRQLRRDVNFLKSKATTLALPAIKKEAKKCTNEAITKVNSLFKQILVAHDTCTQLARKSL